MRILYLGNAQGFINGNKYYFIPQKLVNGFTRLGHNVYVFNDRDYARYSNIFRSQSRGKAKMNDKVVSLCQDYRPDLVVLGHCKNVENETLDRIRAVAPGVRIIYRNVDPLTSAQNVTDIKQRVGVVDGIFITTAGDSLKQFSNNKGGVYFMPNPVDRALETKRAFENPKADIDFLFLASYLRDQEDHRHVTAKYLLEHRGGLNIHIGGAGINDNRVFGADFFDLLGRSKMGLCMNKVDDYYLYASDRMSQYMACGLLAFVPKGSRFDDIFGEGCFVSYESQSDILDKAQHYTKNDTARIEIARRGYTKIHEYFEVDKICQYMIERAFDRPLSRDYQWPTDRY